MEAKRDEGLVARGEIRDDAERNHVARNRERDGRRVGSGRFPRVRALVASDATCAPNALIRVLAITLVALLVAALIPMVAISAFDHSYADDWHYAVDVHAALEAGGGVLGALSTALQVAADTFFSWQGTYSAIVLMALQPGVFGEQLYGLGAVMIMVSLVLSTGYLGSVLMRDLLKADRASWIAVSAAVLLLQTQLLPSPVEGFWWYNSAVYYTFFHALMLVMIGLALRLLRGGSHRHRFTRAGSVARSLGLAVLTFIVGGGNFVTGLVSVLLFGGFALAAIAFAPRRAATVFPAFLVLVAGFVVSMSAPGNAIRQATQFPDAGAGVAATLARSALAGVEYAVLWTNGLMVLVLAIALPVLVRAAARSGHAFRYPGVVLGASLVLFMASFTPTFFSMGTAGPGRVQNIRYDLFVLLVFVCVTWLAGWVSRKLPAAPVLAGRLGILSCPRAFAAYAGSLVLVLALFTGALAADERHVDDIVSISAATSLANGVAEEYDEQIWERIALIEQSDRADVEVPFITQAPKVLFMGDIHDNMDTYINYRLAQWYGKESIIGYDSVL